MARQHIEEIKQPDANSEPKRKKENYADQIIH